MGENWLTAAPACGLFRRLRVSMIIGERSMLASVFHRTEHLIHGKEQKETEKTEKG
jgi:hypothetical protein